MSLVKYLVKILFCSCLLLVSRVAPAVELGSKAVGNTGQLLQVNTGILGDFFPEADPAEAEQHCVVLEIDSNGFVETLLVPSTQDEVIEENPRLAYLTTSGTTVILWETRSEETEGQQIHFALYDGEFSEPETITRQGVPAIMSSSPVIISTSDAFELQIGTETLATDRDVLHVVWQREQATWYTPLLFVEGVYVDWNESIRLDSAHFGHGDTPPEEDLPPLPSAVSNALEVGVASDDSSIVVAFTNTDQRRIGALQIAVLPLELALLSDEIQALIVDRALVLDVIEPTLFGDEIRAEIVVVGLGLNLNSEVVEFVAEQVETWLVGTIEDLGIDGLPPIEEEVELLAEAARDVAIDVTSSLFSEATEAGAEGGEDGTIEIMVAGGCGDSGTAQPTQILDINVQSDLALPSFAETEIDRLEVMTSYDGRRILLAWTETPTDGSDTLVVNFTQGSIQNGWSEVKSVTRTPGTSIDDLFHLLQRRLR